MSGAGFSAAGLDPAGAGSNDASPEVRELGAAVCRRVEPRVGDYSRGLFAAVPGFESMPIVLGKVLVALGNRVGSFAWDPARGDPSLSIEKNDGRLPERITAYTRAQLQPMVDAKEIELVSVEVASVQGAYSRVVTFRELSSGTTFTTGSRPLA